MDDMMIQKGERLRRELEAKLQQEFVRYLEDCKQQLAAEAASGTLRETVRAAARVLARKARGDSTKDPEA